MPEELRDMIATIIEVVRKNAGTGAWFVILIAAKIQFVTNKKKITKGEYISHVLYGLVGGVFAYFGTDGWRENYRIIAIGVGVIAGDIMIGWIRTIMPSVLDIFGEGAKNILKKKTNNDG